MIALLQGELFDITPLVTTDTDFSIQMNDQGNIEAYIGQKRIDYGVIFHSFNKSMSIEANTGKITINYPGFAKIRGVFGDKHCDINIDVKETA